MDQEAALVWAVAAFDVKRQAAYYRYRRYMDGDQPLAFATAKFDQAFGKTFEEWAYNRCRAVVQAHVDRLSVAGWASDDEQLATDATDMWAANQMDLREEQVYAESSAMGDAYVLVGLRDDQDYPDIWPQQADLCRVHYDPDQPGVIDAGVKRWRDEDGRWRLTLYLEDRIVKYATAGRTDTSAPTEVTAWQPWVVGEGEDGDASSNVVMLPVTDTVSLFHFPNDGRINSYGRSDLADVLAIQDGINKTVLDLFVANELIAYPQRLLLNVDPDPETLESIRRIETGVSRILALRPPKNGQPGPAVAEWSAGGGTAYLDTVASMERMICRVTSIPAHYLELSGEIPSGASFRAAETPFVKKITRRSKSHGHRWAGVESYGLRLIGIDADSGDLRVNWDSPSPLSDEERWAIVETKVKAGMPLISALREDGYDPDQIDLILEEQTRMAEIALGQFNTGLEAGAEVGDDDRQDDPDPDEDDPATDEPRRVAPRNRRGFAA